MVGASAQAQLLTNPDARALEQVRAAAALQSTYQNLVSKAKAIETPTADLETFRAKFKPALKNACLQCHGSETVEGQLRVDALDPDLLHGEDVSWWLEVSSAVSHGEMPLEDGPALADDDRKEIVEWLSAEIQKASLVRHAEKEYSSFCRQTRYEYNDALQDRLGLDLDFAKNLSPDPISHKSGQNSFETHQINGKQYAESLEVNRNELYRATINGERPAVLHWSVSAQAASAGTTVASPAKMRRGTVTYEGGWQDSRKMGMPQGYRMGDLSWRRVHADRCSSC